MSLVCLVTALPAESRIFLDALKLRHLPARGIRLYQNGDYLLLQTGLGKLNAAAATGALLHARPAITGLINVGVAGANADLGSVHLAHRVLDAATNQQWYPHLPPQRTVQNVSTASIHTGDIPNTAYQDGVLFDMEAAGVFKAASAYLSSDAVHSVKVVSDNAHHALESLQPARATELMRAAVPVVLQLSDWLLQQQPQSTGNAAAYCTQVDDCCARIRAQVRHSVSDFHQLRRLLQRHLTLTGHTPKVESLCRLPNARAVREHLQRSLQDAPLRYES